MFAHAEKSLQRMLAVILACTAMACTRASSFDDYVREAREFRARRDYAAAIIQAKNALATDPEHGGARFLLGQLYGDIRDYPAAEIELRRAARSNADSAPLAAALARCLIAQREYGKALDELARFEASNPGPTPELLTLQGGARLGLGRKDARASYLSALEQAPSFADARLALARMSASEGKADEALRQVRATLEQSPGHLDAWLFQGDLLRDKGLAGEAQASYRKAVELEPASVQAHLHLADLYLTTDQLDAMRSELDATRAIEPKNLMLVYQRAALALKERRYAEAGETIRPVREQVPDHLPSLLIAGAAAYFTGSTEQADRDLTRYLALFPGAAGARKLLAANSVRGNQPDKALETLAPLLAAGTDAQAFAIAGEAALASGRFAAASKYLQQAAVLSPRDASVRGRLGVSRLAGREVDAGIADLESASALASDGASQTNLALVLARLERKEYEQALAVVARLQKARPNDPSVLNLKAHVLLAQGDTAQARQTLEAVVGLQPGYFPALNSLAVLDARDGRFDAARGRFDAALKHDATRLAAMLALAEVAAAAGSDEERVKWLEKASAVAPGALRPRSLLARHHLARKEPRKAVAVARQAQADNPDSAEALLLLGAVQVEAGERRDAVAAFRGLVRMAPASPQANYQLALALIGEHDAAAARASLEKVLALQPDHAGAEAALAALDADAGDYGQALGHAQRLRSRAPGSPVGAILEGDLRVMQKDFAAAARAYAAALGLSASSEVFVKAHRSLVRAGRSQDAHAQAAAWLKARPADNAARLYLATAAMEAGEAPVAVAQYEAVLEREPGNAAALNNLAWLYHEQGDPRALDVAERAAKSWPGSATILDTLGWLLIQQGSAVGGVEVMRRAVALAPVSGTLRYHLAAGYSKTGDNGKAREALDALIASSEPFRERPQAIALRARL